MVCLFVITPVLSVHISGRDCGDCLEWGHRLPVAERHFDETLGEQSLRGSQFRPSLRRRTVPDHRKVLKTPCKCRVCSHVPCSAGLRVIRANWPAMRRSCTRQCTPMRVKAPTTCKPCPRLRPSVIACAIRTVRSRPTVTGIERTVTALTDGWQQPMLT